jgi:uncharacterized protein YuzE
MTQKSDILAVKLREGEINDEKLLDSDVLLSLDANGPGRHIYINNIPESLRGRGAQTHQTEN